VANQFTETDETSIVRNIGRSRTHYSAGIESFDNLEVDAQAHDRVQQGEAFEERVNKDSSNWSEAKDLPRVYRSGSDCSPGIGIPWERHICQTIITTSNLQTSIHQYPAMEAPRRSGRAAKPKQHFESTPYPTRKTRSALRHPEIVLHPVPAEGTPPPDSTSTDAYPVTFPQFTPLVIK